MILSEISPISLAGSSSPPWSNFGKAFLLNNKALFQAGRLTVTDLRKTSIFLVLSICSFSFFTINFNDTINLHRQCSQPAFKKRSAENLCRTCFNMKYKQVTRNIKKSGMFCKTDLAKTRHCKTLTVQFYKVPILQGT